MAVFFDLFKIVIKMIRKIVSGGQTGVDQAALDAAIAHGVDYGGWLPVGRRTENGPLPARYRMNVLSFGGYPHRTRRNVLDSGATLIIANGPLTGGSALTAKIARSEGKPFMFVDLTKFGKKESVVFVNEWLHKNRPEILNIAGPRASSDETIYETAFNLIGELLRVKR